MSRVYPRRKQQYAFAVLAGLVVAAVVLSFALFYLPVRAEYSGLDAAILELRAGIVQQKGTLERLEEAERRLAEAKEGRALFLSSSLIPRELGYAAMLPELDAMARGAGIERGRVQYDIGSLPQFGVYPVAILMPARGDYASVRRFIERLETSEKFFLLDSIAMAQSEGEAAGVLDVQLTMSTFFADHE